MGEGGYCLSIYLHRSSGVMFFNAAVVSRSAAEARVGTCAPIALQGRCPVYRRLLQGDPATAVFAS